jgi:ABC-type amino acid transport substrate-binding protein
MTAKRMRRILAAWLAVFLWASLWAIPALAASGEKAAPARRTVRVGLPDTDTAGATGGENRTVAFEKDYMQAVAEYANWECVYVPSTWAECLEKVRRGEVDVLLDVSKTEERLAYFNYSSESMGTEMCYLFGRGNTTLQYDDFTAFDGIDIGYEEGSTIIESLREYGQEVGFTFHGVPYPSGNAMFAALDAGEVDAIAQTNLYDTPFGHVILAKISPSPIYIVTSKATPELKTELDQAMAQLFSYNPSFNADLFEYHFGSTVAQSAGYTQQEKDYLASAPVVNVFYETNWAPFEYESGGEAAGITPEVLRAIGRDTGITFQFVLTSSTQAVYQNINGSPIDTVMAVSYDYAWADEHDLLVTQPYVSGTVMRVMKNGGKTPQTVAVVADGYLEAQIRETYPELRRAPYLTFSECMDAVARGEADCTFLNYYQSSYYRSMAPTGTIPTSRTRISGRASPWASPRSPIRRCSAFSPSRSNTSPPAMCRASSVRISRGPRRFPSRMLLRRYPLQMALLFGLRARCWGCWSGPAGDRQRSQAPEYPACRRQARGGGGQQRKVGVSLPHEPRHAHAAQRHHRHDLPHRASMDLPPACAGKSAEDRASPPSSCSTSSTICWT